MIRSNVEMPRVPKDWLDGASADAPANEQPVVRMASTLDYDGATKQLTLTRGDGTVQEFPASNNTDSRSKGRWPNGTFHYERHTTHGENNDTPDGKYGAHGNYIFTVPGREDMGVHSGRASRRDGAGRSGVNHATFGCIRTTDEGTAAIREAMTSGDPVTKITVRNNP